MTSCVVDVSSTAPTLNDNDRQQTNSENNNNDNELTRLLEACFRSIEKKEKLRASILGRSFLYDDDDDVECEWRNRRKRCNLQ